MPTSPLVERTGRRRFETGAHRPFLLSDPDCFYFVEQGHLDIFAVALDRGRVIARRNFVCRVPAGKVAFGCPDGVGQGQAVFGLLAVPSMDAILVEGQRDALDAEAFDLTVTIWIDEWLFGLSEYLARNLVLPRDAHLLEADPDMPYRAGAALSAHHADLVWVSADRPLCIIGRPDLVVDPGDEPVPITERTWLALDADAKVSAVHTPGAMATGRLWPAFDRFSARIIEFSALVLGETAKTLEQRRWNVFAAQRTTIGHALRNLAMVIRAGPRGETASLPADLTSLQAAASQVLKHQGERLISRPDVEDRREPNQIRMAAGRISGLYMRKIALSRRWWRRDGPSFVGFTLDMRPLALLATGRGGYRAVDPDKGTDRVVRAGEAATIARHGAELYPPLPPGVERGTSALANTLRAHRSDLWTVLVMAVLGALVALVTPMLTGKLLVEIIPRVDISMWIAALGAMGLGALGSAMFEIVRALAVLRIEGRVDEHLQAAVWNRLITLPASFFRDFTAGDLADRANGISQIRQLLTGATVSAVLGGMFSVFSFGLLFYYSWSLALVAGAVLLVLIGATWAFSLGQMRHHRVAFRIQGVIDGIVFQLISGLAKLRVANAEHYALSLWAERYAAQRKAKLAARRWAAGQFALNSMFQPLASLALFAYIYYAFIDGDAQPSFDLVAFLSFNAAFGQLLAATIALTGAVTTVVTAIPLFERVEPILAAQPEIARGGTDVRELAGDIEFTNVTFRYFAQGPNAVDNISFRIRPGEYVAFVGTSGSGKSTIYRLLLGFEQPDSGAVFLDGHDLTNLSLPAVRSRMGVVLQNGQLVTGSIHENIAGSSHLTVAEAWQAVIAAGLDEDIRAMPMGMHTVLSEGAGTLSGGQRQRLLIARALAHRPRILLFDEATSALDNRTQAIVQASLGKISSTRLVIAHRLSTIRDVDRIYVLEAGRIVETGRYDDLMALDGTFAALARRQIV
ncbi:MAG: NHLP bacteriocin export ABC transporter permease/ATPase subunit [Rhodospirillales bacterium]|nr:NHLP bacteriocin export ABC transporter permease/ATPase subunit [Rhodospirillales bacterium]